MAKRTALNIEERDAILKELPLEVSDEVRRKVIERFNVKVLVYRCDRSRDIYTGECRKVALVTCTDCRESYCLPWHVGYRGCHFGGYNKQYGFLTEDEAEPIYSGDSVICPVCGACGSALHTSKIHCRKQLDEYWFNTLEVVRNHMVVLYWCSRVYVDKNGVLSYEIHPYTATAVIEGHVVKYASFHNTLDGKIIFFDRWKPRVKFHDSCNYSFREDFLSISDITGTDAEHTAFDVYLKSIRKIRWEAYLYAWSKCPSLENLTRNRGSGYIERMLEDMTEQLGNGYYVDLRLNISALPKYIYTKKKSPFDMLGLNKQEYYLLIDYLTSDFLFLYRFLRTRGVKLSSDMWIKVRELGLSAILKFLQSDFGAFEVPIIHTINYLHKLNKSDNHLSTEYLRDYWDLLLKVDGCIAADVAFPRDLKAAHDAVNARYKHIKDELIDKNIRKRAKQLSVFAFSDEETGLMIYPCPTEKQIVAEGRSLHHCVARYAESYSNGETNIFFIRHLAYPRKAYFTLEYNIQKNFVVQNRGSHNCVPTPEVIAFEAKWLEYIKTLTKKEH